MAINAGNNVTEPLAEATLKKLELIFRVWELLDVAMVGVGPGELHLGLDNLKTISTDIALPLVCTNLEPDQEGASFVTPTVTRTWQGKTFLMVSVVDPALLQPSSGVRLTSPVEAVRRAADDVPHDFLVVVVHANTQEAKDIVAEVQGIDVVILGRGRSWTHQGSPVPPLVVANNSKGMNLAWAEITDTESSVQAGRVEKSSLDEGLEEDDQVAAMIGEYKEWFEDSQKYAGRLDEIRRWSFMGVDMYAGAGSCRWCHKKEFESWAETRHARAMETVQDSTDPHCLSCHVTGMNDSQAMNGFISPDTTPNKANVQCEACHGPGGSHLLEPEMNEMVIPDESSCSSCHTEEWSPDFNYYLYRYKGVHQ